MNPQQKKQLSLKRDRRNCYGENDKSSRKAIRQRKRWVNRAYRRAVKQSISVTEKGATEIQDRQVRKKRWKKTPDKPLGEVLQDKVVHTIMDTIRDANKNDPAFLSSLRDALIENGFPRPQVVVIMRRLRTYCLAPWGIPWHSPRSRRPRPDIDYSSAKRIERIVKSLIKSEKPK